MDLRYIESTLPAGFRFCPSDEELLCYYLQKKVTTNDRASQGTMVEVDLHTHEPWELPEAAKLNKNEWYFFSFRDRKYATGWRSNRATKSGYWKATGRDRTVCDPKSREVVGMRKTLVFYEGRAPNGRKTNWVMHEFRLEALHTPPKEGWVLCRVFNKNKGGPVKYTSENEQENTGNSSCFSSVYMDLDLSPPRHDQQMPDSRACHGHVTTSAFPLLPQQEGTKSSTLLDLAWLHFDFLESKGSGEDGGLLFDMGLDEGEHDHELLGGGMDGNFGASSGVVVPGGNSNAQAFF
ncbi:NAC domain-containing protein 21/22-like [Curcuma longa]|uniref:NAC domain-containing protein 21/22-like n=1 Tax=Curcuma longa TaxID=136217 RepID=UPI003D9ECE39